MIQSHVMNESNWVDESRLMSESCSILSERSAGWLLLTAHKGNDKVTPLSVCVCARTRVYV